MLYRYVSLFDGHPEFSLVSDDVNSFYPKFVDKNNHYNILKD